MIVNILCDYSLCLSDQMCFCMNICQVACPITSCPYTGQIQNTDSRMLLTTWFVWKFSVYIVKEKCIFSVIVQNKTSERTTLMYKYELLHLRRLEWGNGACESILTVWGNSTVSTKLLPIVDWTAAHKMLPLSSDDAISDDKMLTLSSSSWSCCLCNGAFESVKSTVWGDSFFADWWKNNYNRTWIKHCFISLHSFHLKAGCLSPESFYIVQIVNWGVLKWEWHHGLYLFVHTVTLRQGSKARNACSRHWKFVSDT